MPYKDQEKRRARQKTYYKANRERINAYNRADHAAKREALKSKKHAYYVANKGRITEKIAQYRKANPEVIKDRKAAYYAANRNRIKSKSRAYYHANIEQATIRRARTYARNQEKAKAYSSAYYFAHIEAVKAYAAAYRATNPDLLIAVRERYRARKAAAPINDLTVEQWRAIKEHYGHCCVYCGKESQRLTQDHITPLSKGGSHTLQNVVPACRSCNSKKHIGPPLQPIQPLLLTPR